MTPICPLCGNARIQEGAIDPAGLAGGADGSHRGQRETVPPPTSLPLELEPITAWLATADATQLHNAVVLLTMRVSTLERERSALEFAAQSFGALADRLTAALRAARETPPSSS